MDPIVQAFLEEADELLADYEASLLRISEGVDDDDTLNRIFRCAHTIKGNSSMLGFDVIAKFTHKLEDLLDQLRKRTMAVTPDVVTVLLAAGDAIRSLFVQIQEDSESRVELPAVAEVYGQLDATLKGNQGPVSEGPAPAAGGELPPEAVDTATPSAAGDGSDDGRPAAPPPGVGPAAGGDATADAMPSPVSAVPSAPSAAISSGAPAGNADKGAANRGGGAAISSLRVPVEKVDRLINLVGELVITQSIVAQTVENFAIGKLGLLLEAVNQMDRHARELRERIMAVRMIPIKSLFSRFQRLVHDLVAVTGKRAALDIRGEDTELDKTVLEKMGDPLTHLIRNSLDHGLETPEERLRVGKPEVGLVRLEAYQRGGNIYIEISDDGRGLNRDRILAKAVQNGLIEAGTQLSDEQVNALIFRPGFSTAETVTAISGRGVGMDVVRKNVEALGGTISIRSELGRGTQFRIALPLTLAILDGQMLRSAEQVYILPLVSITESIQVNEAHIHRPAGGGEIVVVRDRVVPILRLAELFGIGEGSEIGDGHGLLVVVENEEQLAAIYVDELLGQQQVVIKSLEENFQKLDGVSGATILGDGRVALILDVPGLVYLAGKQSLVPA